MSTRHVQTGDRRKPHGYASAPEYDCLHGLDGTALSLKAALQSDPVHRELLYSLLTLSQRVGGVERIASELVEMFPERIGTDGMFERRFKHGQKIKRSEAATISWELDSFAPPRPVDDSAIDCRYDNESVGESKALPEFLNVEEAQNLFGELKRVAQENLPARIEDICYNPKVPLDAGAPCFRDLLGALIEYRRRHVEVTRENYVATSISQVVVSGLDYALRSRKPVLIEGESGFGKTEGLAAWSNMHLGQMIFVRLTGITHPGNFIKMLAEKCGLAKGRGLSAGKVQLTVETFFKRTKLLLVIDESQYIWPQGKRIVTHPAIVNWLNTALYNEGVPFALIATKQFSASCIHVAAETGWNAEQLNRRLRKKFPLPDRPTDRDLELVARKLLASVGITAENAVDEVVGYAQETGGYFQTIVDSIDDARMLAEDDGRAQVTYKDLVKAIDEFRTPSDAAKLLMFQPRGRKSGKAATRPQAVPAPREAAAVQESCIASERALQPPSRLTGPRISNRALSLEVTGTS